MGDRICDNLGTDSISEKETEGVINNDTPSCYTECYITEKLTLFRVSIRKNTSVFRENTRNS